MKVDFIDATTHLDALCEGVWDPVEVTGIARQIRAVAEQLGRDRLFVDWSRVSMPTEPSHRVFAGQDIAAILSPPLRVAVLYRKAFINHEAERVARSRGATLFVHHDQALLRSWLLGTDSASAGDETVSHAER